MVVSAMGDNQEVESEQTEGADSDRYKYEQLEQFRNSQKYAEQLLKRYEAKARELEAKTTRYNKQFLINLRYNRQFLILGYFQNSGRRS